MPVAHTHNGFNAPTHKLPAIVGLSKFSPQDDMQNWRHRCRQEPEGFGVRNCAELSMLQSGSAGPRGRTPVSMRTEKRRPPTGANYPNGGPLVHIKEAVLGLGSTLQRVSDDMVGRHVAEGRASKAPGVTKARPPSNPKSDPAQWWSSATQRQMQSGSTSNQMSLKQAAEREAAEERKVAEMYLQVHNHKQAQKHLSQSARLLQMAATMDQQDGDNSRAGNSGPVSRLQIPTHDSTHHRMAGDFRTENMAGAEADQFLGGETRYQGHTPSVSRRSSGVVAYG